MRTSCVKNGLVMVVILLFIGVAVQPSIATVQPEKIIAESDSDDIEKNCDCKNKFSSVSDFLEKYGKLSDFISLNNSPYYGPPICWVLVFIINRIGELASFFDDLADNYPEDSFSYKFFSTLFNLMFLKAFLIYLFGGLFDCWYYPP